MPESSGNRAIPLEAPTSDEDDENSNDDESSLDSETTQEADDMEDDNDEEQRINEMRFYAAFMDQDDESADNGSSIGSYEFEELAMMLANQRYMFEIVTGLPSVTADEALTWTDAVCTLCTERFIVNENLRRTRCCERLFHEHCLIANVDYRVICPGCAEGLNI